MKDKTKKQQVSTKRPHQIERKRIILLIMIMAVISLIIVLLSVNLLFRTAIEEQKARLVETAQSQARLMEAVARHDAKYEASYPEGAEQATLNQIIDAHANYKGFGKTGEFALARREGNEIVFLLSHRHFDLEYPRPVAFNSELAEPMRRALSGQSGTLVGLDYRAGNVLAAHEPVAELNLGIVAKIDMTEIRAPFIRAGLISFGAAVLAILFGAVLFVRVTNPIIKRITVSEERYRRLVETMSDGLGVQNEKEFITYANDRFCEILGRTHDEIIEHKLSEFLDEANRKILMDQMTKRRKGISDSYELLFTRKDGSKIPTIVSPGAIYDEEGRFKGSFAVITDITERKKSEEKIEASLREKEVLLREIHHRVKNNLQVIISLLGLQSQSVESKQLSELLKESQGRIKSMALINEKLYLSKDVARIDFKEYILTLVNGLIQTFKPSPDKIAINIEAKDVTVGIDQAVYFGLIINELVFNSLKHAFPDGRKGKITVAMRSINDDEIELSVSDNGIGIPKDFDLKKTKSLGLHLVTILAEDQLQGEIKLNRDKGTKFYIRLRGVKQ